LVCDLFQTLTVIRPADANETVQAWRVALEHKGGPIALVLTRQGIPIIDQKKFTKANELEKGAYIVSESERCSTNYFDCYRIGGSINISCAAEIKRTWHCGPCGEYAFMGIV
jgi:transketolase